MSDFPVGFAALSPEARQRFLAARAAVAPRVWALLEGELGHLEAEAHVARPVAILALADALLDAARTVLESHQAIEAAGGDVDVAALLLGIGKAASVAGGDQPRRPRRRAREGS